MGAGSAGCVLANRLSGDSRNRVLLIEAGPPDASPLIRIPKGFGKLLADPKHAWFFPTEPESGNGQRSEYWVRGKTLGGSSALNGMVYVRGQPQDYDHWESLGLNGWGWRTLAPYFKRMENHTLGADEHRGAGGPLGITTRPGKHPLADAVIGAGRSLGLPVKEDLNRPEQEGIGYLCFTIQDGKRQSAAEAFLKPARRRPNLRIMTDTLVERVLFEGNRAVGVIARGRDGERIQYRAGREVILCAGALNSPKLLQLSGIGPAELLCSMGIEVVANSQDVGRNMREHRLLFLQYRLKRAVSINHRFSGLPLLWSSLQYAVARRGVLALGSYDVGGFIRTRPELERPDAQIMMAPHSLDLSAKALAFERFPGMQIFGYVLRPESRGSVMLRSADPQDSPVIRPNYLSTEYDRRTSVDCVRWMRRWMSQPSIAPLLDEETTPGPLVQSDEEILDAFSRLGQAGYHAAGTARMGTDERAVLDDRLRVRGVSGLRVVDLSVLPSMISGNTNGPMMALAWRAADLILEDASVATQAAEVPLPVTAVANL